MCVGVRRPVFCGYPGPQTARFNELKIAGRGEQEIILEILNRRQYPAYR